MHMDNLKGGEEMLTENERKKKEEVTIAVGNWILEELEKTSSFEYESILPDVIKAFFACLYD